MWVPRASRHGWLEEWEGELWALDRRATGWLGLLGFAWGGVGDAARESILDHGEGMMATRGLWQDVRSAMKRLGRAPGFTFVTVTVLALGIGANTALFGALRSALVQGAPYTEAGRLVVVDLLLGAPGTPPDTLPWSYPKYETIAGRMDFLSGSAAYTTRMVTVSGAGDPVREPVELVSPSYFSLLDVEPSSGRTLQPTDAPPADQRVLVLAHHSWLDWLGADPDVLGRVIHLNGASFQVVGVARRGFRGLTGSAAGWVPIGAAPLVMDARRLEREWSHWFRVAGRLSDGVSLDGARAAAAGLGPPLTGTFPHPERADMGHDVALTPLEDARVNATSRLAVAVVGVGAVLLLLIAAANAAGLMLARMAARRGDLAVRAALGAGRGRLAREAFAESVLLAVAGGGVGIILAVVGQRGVAWAVSYALETSGSRNLQFMDPATVAPPGLLPTVGVVLALATGLVFGLAPARLAGRSGLSSEMTSSGRGRPGTAGRGPGESLRGVLVAAQLALTLVLLSGAGLMLASFTELESVALGFQAEGVLTARYELGSEASRDEVLAFESDVVERLAALPGVDAASVAVCAPLAGLCDITGVREVDGAALPESATVEWMHTQSVTPSFFETAGVRIVGGTGLPGGLTPADPPVVVLSEAAADTYFRGTDPIGRTIGLTHGATPEGRPAEIIGIVEDVAYQELEAEPFPTLYFNSEQVPAGWGQILVRASGDAAALGPALRATVLSLRPDLPVWDVTTAESRRAAATARTRVILGLLATFGLTALLLTTVGLWGLVSYAVTRRTREMGLRMALGAGRTGVLRLVSAGPARLALIGAVLGWSASVLLNRHLSGLLFRVDPGDIGVRAMVLTLLVSVAVAAALIPALRATRVDPAESLRSE
ncbi:MAG TPA: ADOP family duplicated permease [Longimicrobiales bacterium]|nr:ADOP family duplicated permease [Longimicrobiales bacterium]